MRAILLLAAVVCAVAQNAVDTDINLTAGTDAVNIDFASGEIVRLANIPASATLRLNKGNAATSPRAQAPPGYVAVAAQMYDIIYTATLPDTPATYTLPAFTTETVSSDALKVLVQNIAAVNAFNQVGTAPAGSSAAVVATDSIVLTKDSNANIYRGAVQVFTVANPETAGQYSVCTVTNPGTNPATCAIEGTLLTAMVSKAQAGTSHVVFYSNTNGAPPTALATNPAVPLNPVANSLNIWVAIDMRGASDVTVNLKSDVPQARFTGGITAPTADIADLQIAGFGRVETSSSRAVILRENPSSATVPNPNDNNVVTIETTGIMMNGLYVLVMESDMPTTFATPNPAALNAAATFAATTRSVAVFGDPEAGRIIAEFAAESTATMNADTSAFPASAGFTLPTPLVSYIITYSANPTVGGTVIVPRPTFITANQKYSVRVLRCTPTDGVCPSGTPGVPVPTTRRPDGTVVFQATESGIYTIAMVQADIATRTLTADNNVFSTVVPTNTPVNLVMGDFSLPDFTCNDPGRLTTTVSNTVRETTFVPNALANFNKIGGFRTLTTDCNSFTTTLRDTYTVAQLGSNTASTVTFGTIPDSPAAGDAFTAIASTVNTDNRIVTSTNPVTTFSIFGLFASGSQPAAPTTPTAPSAGGGTNNPAAPGAPATPAAPSPSGATYLLPTVSAMLLSVAALLCIFQ